MENILRLSTLALSALLSLPAAVMAADAGISVQEPWVRASAPGQSNGAGYMTIGNGTARADTLLSVSSKAASRVEVHNVVTENGVARMVHVEGVPVPAQGEAVLAPGGYHVMFLKLAEPFKAGTEIPATLRFEHAGDVPVVFKVEPIGHNPGGGHGGHAGHGAHKH